MTGHQRVASVPDLLLIDSVGVDAVVFVIVRVCFQCLHVFNNIMWDLFDLHVDRPQHFLGPTGPGR